MTTLPTFVPTMRPLRKSPPPLPQTPSTCPQPRPSSQINPSSPVTPPGCLQSSPRSSLRSTPPQQLDTLTESQLTHLTRSNTRKNLGTRRSRLRSQLERVCRKLDNLALDVRLPRRPVLLQPVPVVTPDDHPVASDSPSDERMATPPKHDFDPPTDEDCFAIEPATPQDIFMEKSSRASALTDGDGSSKGRCNTESSATTQKSVRISTSVTFLDYSRGRKNQGVSVSTGTRINHPTCNDRSLLLRKAMTEADGFPRAKLNIGSLGNGDEEKTEARRNLVDGAHGELDSGGWMVVMDAKTKRASTEAVRRNSAGGFGGYNMGGSGVGKGGGVPFAVASAGGGYAARPKMKTREAKQGEVTSVGPSCVPTSTTTPKAAYAVPSCDGEGMRRKASSSASK